MKTKLTTLLMVLALHAVAQTPIYPIVAMPNNGLHGGGGNFYGNGKWQCIYSPRELSSLPHATITAVYFLINFSYPQHPPYTFTNFAVRLGYSPDTMFRKQPQNDCFKTGLTTVFQRTSYTNGAGDTAGKWWRFPCTDGQFAYNGTGWMVVEIRNESLPAGQGYNLSFTSRADTAWRLKGGIADSACSIAADRSCMDIGFDVSTTGIAGISNLTSFGLFPNPATGGRFNVSLHAKAALRKVELNATNIAGQPVWRQTYEPGSTDCFKEVDMSALPKGVCVLNIRADGETMTRNVILE